jgi:hypothetical protein
MAFKSFNVGMRFFYVPKCSFSAGKFLLAITANGFTAYSISAALIVKLSHVGVEMGLKKLLIANFTLDFISI